MKIFSATFNKYASRIVLLIFIGICFAFQGPNSVNKISVHLVTKTLHNKKSFIINGDIYYQVDQGLLVTRYTSPLENIMISNSLGEVKVYDPKKNTVALSQGKTLSSENNMLYYFLKGKTQDMGLRSSGFTIKSTRFEGSNMITDWVPLPDKGAGYYKAQLVSDRFKPIYMAFYKNELEISKKTYFSDYKLIENINLPAKITEIHFVSLTDSVISRQQYSDIKINGNVDDTWLNFKIPASAKVVK